MVHRFIVVAPLAVGVLGLGACAGNGANPATTPDTPPAASTGTDIAVTGTDGLRFEPGTLPVPAGEEVTLNFSAETVLEHDFVIEGAADRGDLHVVHADPGQTTAATLQIDQPGTYTVYCSVAGHREAGMEGILVVEG